jgi:aminopeptidase N
VDGGRRFFRYTMDIPILHFYSYLSADYAVRRDRWNDVAIEIYYHEPHAYNLDRMIDSIRKSLDYFTENFGPYQHRQVRIIEFPRYAAFAQSFPNTIPYSESVGFIAEVRDEEDIDYIFYITAHEVAHQWWAHQVIGANVQGATMLSESLSQYSALMVMEKEYGAEKMRRFLKYELDRYLRDRGGELVEELPLMLVENQMYIHYQKGSVIMYALRDYLGEEVLNGALRRYRDAVAYQEPPYTTTKEFMAYIREATPDSLAYILEDMFETITLFSNRVEEAVITPREDGRYGVRLAVESKKMRADGQGVETEIEIGDWIDIGIFGEKEIDGKKQETLLYLKKHRIDANEMTFDLVVDGKPVRAGIDPYNKLIDRNSDDNVMKVQEIARESPPLGLESSPTGGVAGS